MGVWGQFILWFVLYLAAELFYGFFPPPAYPWGIIGMSVTHLFIQVLLWWAMYYNTILFDRYRHRKYFFGLWALVLFAMEVTFFLRYVLIDRWTSYIAVGVGAAILVIAALVFPVKEPYSSATTASGEPLLGPTPDRVIGDTKEDKDDE